MKLKMLMALFFTSALILSGCATAEQKEVIERRHYSTFERDVGYTQAVQVGSTLYLSGVGSEGKTLIDQLNGIYQTIENILADYNAEADDIVKEVIYTTNIEQLKQAISTRKQFFRSQQYPASTWVQVERLFLPGMQVEVEVIVRIP